MKTQEKKTTNEKPISLYPFDFREILAATLKIKPESKLPKRRQKHQKKTG